MKRVVIGSFVFAALLNFGISANAEIVGKEITYSSDGTTMKGYIAYDDAIKGERPGVLVVHEWWGHNDYARMRARMLAELGYTALAVDMYGNGKTASHPKEAGAFAGEVRSNMKQATERFKAAKELLEDHETTDPEQTAAIGYCFGGGVVLEMARRGVDLDAVVSFHGSLATQNPAQEGEVKARVLVAHGEEDPFVKPNHVSELKQEMEKANVDFTFKAYPNAKHSFTNPEANEYGKKFDLPLEYNEAADKQSWNDMKKFLKETFEGG